MRGDALLYRRIEVHYGVLSGILFVITMDTIKERLCAQEES